jgi:hypothetical protein
MVLRNGLTFTLMAFDGNAGLAPFMLVPQAEAETNKRLNPPRGSSHRLLLAKMVLRLI